MTAERKRVPEVHLEIVRRLSDANKFRPETERLSIPSRNTIYREIQRKSPYELMVARYGKRRAEMEYQGVRRRPRHVPHSSTGNDGSHAERHHRRG